MFFTTDNFSVRLKEERQTITHFLEPSPFLEAQNKKYLFQYSKKEEAANNTKWHHINNGGTVIDRITPKTCFLFSSEFKHTMRLMTY